MPPGGAVPHGAAVPSWGSAFPGMGFMQLPPVLGNRRVSPDNTRIASGVTQSRVVGIR